MSGSTQLVDSTGSTSISLSTAQGTTALASPLNTPENVQGTINNVEAQKSQLTDDLIAQADTETAKKLQDLKTLLGTISDTLGEYKALLSTRRHKRETCSTYSEQRDKLTTVKENTDSLIALAEEILQITSLPTSIKDLVTTFKAYHENHREELIKEIEVKNNEISSC